LDIFTGHNNSDRWEPKELEHLVQMVPSAEQHVEKLLGQPKDGAILLDDAGTVKGVALHLKYPSARLVLMKSDGMSAGTRHASALGFAEWLGLERSASPSLVFTRSDGGGAHAFIPGTEEPCVLAFKTLEVPTQAEMLVLFKAKIMKEGKLMRKVLPVLIRPGRPNERVLTLVSGRVTAEVEIEGDSSAVCRANTVDHELYVLPKSKFQATYEVPGIDLRNVEDKLVRKLFLPSQVKQLTERGFQMHKPRPDQLRWVYELTAEDLKRVPTGRFKTMFGAIQSLKPGDCLAMPAPEKRATELYYMPDETVQSYEDVGPHCNHIYDQSEMLSLFKQPIMAEGKLMYKSMPALIRKATRGECVETCVNGRITSELIVGDDESMVVRGPVFNELYVLSKEKFVANWQQTGSDIVENGCENADLKRQGFKWHLPLPGNYKWIYKLKPSDLNRVPSGQFVFETSWGAIQSLRMGDHLAMPAPEECATEIWLVPSGVLQQYACKSVGPRLSL
jgi:hypothetical protein